MEFTQPKDLSTNAPVDATISVEYDRWIAASKYFNNITLQPYINGQLAPAVETNAYVKYTQLNIEPNEELAYGTKYRVRIPYDAIKGDPDCTSAETHIFTFTTVPATISYDVNSDGNLDISDLLWAASRLGPAAEPDAKKADFNGDNKVDIKDLLLLNQNITG